MSEFVGVKNEFDFIMEPQNISSNLKREAIILDKIPVLYLDSVLKSKEVPEDTINDMLWLQEKGSLYDLVTPKPVVRLSEEFWKYKDLADEIFELIKDEHPHVKLPEDIKVRFEATMIMTQLDTRAACLYLREVNKINAVPSFSHFCNPILDLQPRDVLSIVVKQLPVIGDIVPWEQILDFKADPNSRSKFLAFRNWINEVAKNELSPIEIEQKLEYLIDQYKQHMKVHKMKTNTGALQTFITSTAEVLGNLVSFKWGKAAEALFSLKKRQADLLEGELKSPGNEIAYIIKAQESFK
jgi:hypothetical protein